MTFLFVYVGDVAYILFRKCITDFIFILVFICIIAFIGRHCTEPNRNKGKAWPTANIFWGPTVYSN